MNRKTRTVSLLALFLVAMLVLAPVALAYEGREGARVVIAQGEVINDDLFVGGETVIVDGTVNGDLIAVGQIVTVNGTVTGNVIMAGSSLIINGQVGHDVFAGAAVVTLGPNARVSYNAYTAGASVESQAGSLVGGSLLVGAGQGLVSGQVTNDLLVGAGRLRLEGTVGRNAKVSVGGSQPGLSPSMYRANMPPMPSVQPGLTFGPEARVTGRLEYFSPEEVEGAGAVSSQVTHSLPPQDEQLSRELARQRSTSAYLFNALRRLIALLVVGLLFAWLAPRWITAPAEKLLSRVLPSLGVGLVGLVAVPITWLVALGVVVLVAVLFGLLSLGPLTGLTLLAGLPAMGLAAVAILLVLGYLCQAIIAYLGGRWLLSRVRPDWNNTIYAPVLIGLFILGLLFAVPVVGGVLEFLVIIAGLGAIALVVFRGRGEHAPQAPAAPAPFEA